MRGQLRTHTHHCNLKPQVVRSVPGDIFVRNQPEVLAERCAVTKDGAASVRLSRESEWRTIELRCMS
jgi:hypothetical protein